MFAVFCNSKWSEFRSFRMFTCD